MAYKRRYMRPFVGTTIVIQDDAITQDKIDEKAVKEAQLGDQAVSERAMGPASVTSEALKDGEVKTADIGDAQVTEPKLADGAVTENKLSFTPSTRPLTPGVGSAEILDDAVVESKYGDDSIPSVAYKPGSVDEAALGGDAVTTVKIMDDNVTGSKIPASAIDNLHLKADSVRGTEIQDGAVSEDKIGTDAVTTLKIKAANVTESRLQGDILRRLLDSSQLLYDDFIGAALRPEWAASGDPGGSISRANSELSIITNATNDHFFRVNTGGDFFTSEGDKPNVFLRGKQTISDIHVRFGLYGNANNYILFDFDTDVDGDWHVKCKRAGVETSIPTNVAATTLMHDFFFEVLLPNQVKFYIDNVAKGIITTNVPSTILMPWMEVQNRNAGTHTFKVDKFIFSSLNSVGLPPP
ncbi:hypothetical protein ES703_32961 [subsurface metagenome]